MRSFGPEAALGANSEPSSLVLSALALEMLVCLRKFWVTEKTLATLGIKASFLIGRAASWEDMKEDGACR